jgi:hypothetical protein
LLLVEKKGVCFIRWNKNPRYKVNAFFLILPMEKISTPQTPSSVKKKSVFLIEPKASTLDFLRIFARVYPNNELTIPGKPELSLN